MNQALQLHSAKVAVEVSPAPKFRLELVKPEPPKIQIQSRPKKITTPNDKLTRTLFNLPVEEFTDMIFNGVGNCVTENPKSRTSKVKTKFRLENVGTCELSEPLNEFDRAILDVCVSAQQAGASVITADIIWRMMAGDKSRNTKVRPSQKAAVLASVERLMSLRITVDFSQACAKMKRYSRAGKRLVSTILPCKYVDGVTVNGQPDCAVIYFFDESPLLTIARAKSQLLTYDVSLLDVPNQNNTTPGVRLKSYLVRRVHEIIAHKMTPTITFADVFKKCGLVDANNDKKHKARKFIRDVFEHLKTEGKIRDFELEKIDGIYRAVKFNY